MNAKDLILVEGEGGCRLRLRVKPGAKQDTLVGEYNGRLKMTVVAPPEKNRANESVARVLAGALNLATSRVKVVGGFISPDKTVFIEGCTAEEVRKRLEKMPRISTGAQRV